MIDDDDNDDDLGARGSHLLVIIMGFTFSGYKHSQMGGIL
jgi:hypothetical protein